MSSKVKHQSLTPATQWLRQHDIPFEEKSYEYVEHGGTALAVNLGEMGIVLGISRGRNRRKIQEA